MILGFKTKFPWGEPTNFKEKILKHDGFTPKIHSIRESFRFKPGTVINFATGVRTKAYNEFNRDTCKSIQHMSISKNKEVFIDTRYLGTQEIELLAKNDGFDSSLEFFKWFEKQLPFRGIIIHWTNFKY